MPTIRNLDGTVVAAVERHEKLPRFIRIRDTVYEMQLDDYCFDGYLEIEVVDVVNLGPLFGESKCGQVKEEL